MSDENFLAEIAANPDDPAPYLIYSDALQLRGDPRGDLISIQHGLETATPEAAADLRRRESELLDLHEEAWLGRLCSHRSALALRWRYGFVHAARILPEDEFSEPLDEAAAPAGSRLALRALLDAPALASTLAELRIGSPSDIDGDDAYPPCQELLEDVFDAEHAIRRLHVCDVDLRGMFLAPPLRIPERAKALDKLVVQSSALTFAWDTSPAKLRVLEVRTPRLDARALANVREWPDLESLTVWAEDASGIFKLLDRAPRLKHLALCGTANTPHLAIELARHPVIARLATLSLTGGVLTMTKALHDVASRVKLDVRFNKLGKPEREKLAAFGAAVHLQRRGGGALTDRDTLVAFHDKITTNDDLVAYDDVAGMKVYRKLVASTPDPSWVYQHRYDHCRDMVPAEKRDGLAELVRECAAELLQVGSQDRADVYYTIADICDDLVEHFEAECWLWQCVQETRWHQVANVEINALGFIGTLRMRRGDPKSAAPLLDRVVEYFDKHGSKSQHAWALRQRGNVDLVRSEYDSAEIYYRRALDIYRGLRDRDNESIVLSELSGVLWSRQDFEGAVGMIRESIAMRAKDSVGLGSAYYNLGAVLNGMDRLDESIEAAQQSLAIFRKHKRSDGEGQALSLLGELMQRSNRHAEAQPLLEQALALHRERGAVRESGITLGNLARVALDRAEYKRAREYAEEAVELHRECHNKYNEGMQLLDSADAMIGLRRLDEARAFTDEAMIPLVAINNLPGIAAVKGRRGYVAQLRGDFADADRHYLESIDDAKRGNYPESAGWTQLYRAVAAAQQRRHDEAHELVEIARPILTSIQGAHTLAMTEAVIARLAGKHAELPEALGFDAHLIKSFAT